MVFLDLPNFLLYLHVIFPSNFSLTYNTSYWKFPRCTMLCVISMCAQSLQLYPTLWDPMDWSPPGPSVLEDSPGKNTTVGCHALLRVSSRPRDGTCVFYISYIASGFFTPEPEQKPMIYPYTVPLNVEIPTAVFSPNACLMDSYLPSLRPQGVAFTAATRHQAEPPPPRPRGRAGPQAPPLAQLTLMLVNQAGENHQVIVTNIFKGRRGEQRFVSKEIQSVRKK